MAGYDSNPYGDYGDADLNPYGDGADYGDGYGEEEEFVDHKDCWEVISHFFLEKGLGVYTLASGS
jgi:hypothetical protein